MSVSREDLYRFIRQRKLGVVSSMSDASTPQSALIGIAVTPDLEIIFDTTKSTRKYSNLIVRPQCSLVIGWEAEQTLQYEGRAEELQPPDLARYQEIYFQAWPDGPARLTWPGIVYFIVRPLWVRYSDFAQDPPLIEELQLPVLS